MNSNIFLRCLVVAVIIVEINCNCFDAEKMATDKEKVKKQTEQFIELLKGMCKKEADLKKCMKEKLVELLNSTILKNEIQKYIADKAKGEEISKLIDDCWEKEKMDYFSCYFNGIHKICPESKDYLDEYKKEHSDWF